MPVAQELADHLAEDEVLAHYESSGDPVELRRWLVILWKLQGKKHAEIARLLQRGPMWVTKVVRRYNELGPDGMPDQRAFNGSRPLLDEAQCEQLVAQLDEPAPDGGVWTGPKLKRWIEVHLDVEGIGLQTIYDTLHRLGGSW